MQADALLKAVKGVTNKWAKQRKAEERHAQRFYSRRSALTTRSYRITIKYVAYDVMKDAYLRASGGGRLPAHARQVFYAARPAILERASDCDTVNSAYFTQRLLPDYMAEHPDETATWDVVFDARGHLQEPHTGKEVPLGTLPVRNYLSDLRGHEVAPVHVERLGERKYPTVGPANRFGAVLFVEKEGFFPLFKSVRLAERHDLAIMSTKGMSNTAARGLVERVCHGIPLLVLHDFDKAGFSILGTLQRDTRRYSFSVLADVRDLGLRLSDVQACELQSEPVYLKSHPRRNLRENGATEEEIEFLASGQRVELNAFTSDQLVEWLEGKLKEQGVEKVIPGDSTLEAAYRRAALASIVNKRLDEVHEEATRKAERMQVNLPKLRERVKAGLEKRPRAPWDRIVAECAERAVEEAEADQPGEQED